MSDLRKKLIRLAHSKPDLREDLLPLLKKASGPWQLYDMPGVGEASKALTSGLSKVKKDVTRAVKKLVREHQRGRYEDVEELLWFSHPNHKKFGWAVYQAYSDAMKEHLDPLMKQYADFGAQDPEPLRVARWGVAKALGKHVGGEVRDWADTLY